MKSKPKIAIIDYQLSNLFSVAHACDFIGLETKITSDKKEIIHADAAILPGVGAFGDAMNNLQKLGLIDAINKFVESRKPFMGVCLGLQLLFTESKEFGTHKGLDIIEGVVNKFPKVNKYKQIIKVPQIGWNTVYQPDGNINLWNNSPFQGIKNNEFMYFVHSYYVSPKSNEVILSLTNYDGVEYCSSVIYKNVFATQFHPEKSGKEGLKIYQNWAKTIT